MKKIDYRSKNIPLDADQVYELAKQGYIQKEIAEKLGYTPSRFNQKLNKAYSVKLRMEKGFKDAEKVRN